MSSTNDIELKMKRVGQRIREERKKKGKAWTQKFLASEANSSDTIISRIETGDYDVKLETLFRIANALDVDVEKLFVTDQKHETHQKLVPDNTPNLHVYNQGYDNMVVGNTYGDLENFLDLERTKEIFYASLDMPQFFHNNRPQIADRLKSNKLKLQIVFPSYHVLRTPYHTWGLLTNTKYRNTQHINDLTLLEEWLEAPNIEIRFAIELFVANIIICTRNDGKKELLYIPYISGGFGVGEGVMNYRPGIVFTPDTITLLQPNTGRLGDSRFPWFEYFYARYASPTEKSLWQKSGGAPAHATGAKNAILADINQQIARSQPGALSIPDLTWFNESYDNKIINLRDFIHGAQRLDITLVTLGLIKRKSENSNWNALKTLVNKRKVPLHILLPSVSILTKPFDTDQTFSRKNYAKKIIRISQALQAVEELIDNAAVRVTLHIKQGSPALHLIAVNYGVESKDHTSRMMIVPYMVGDPGSIDVPDEFDRFGIMISETEHPDWYENHSTRYLERNQTNKEMIAINPMATLRAMQTTVKQIDDQLRHSQRSHWVIWAQTLPNDHNSIHKK